MNTPKSTYRFGLYGRCPSCKDISKEVCEGCGATEAFTDSVKPGIVICTECGLEHSVICSKSGCSNQIKNLRTPKTSDEKARIDEFLYRKQHKDLDKRVFTIKETPKVKMVKEVSVTKAELEKKEKEKQSIINLDSEIDIELVDAADTSPAEVSPDTEKKPSQEAEVLPSDEGEISLKEETEKHGIVPKAGSSEPSVEEKQELDKIKSFWKSKELTAKEEKKEEERRIVNQFYDEQDDDALDKKINFENVYNETVYFDCRSCGTEEQKIDCDKCGQSSQFSLNYDALSCKCGNEIKVRTCPVCGAKHGHSDFYLVSDGIKWQYSKSKSYYNYRKGRMLAFSTCPTCNVFSVEKCRVCGSKVNFGIPNKNNEAYCKNCGTINQFTCANRNCNDTIKMLKNPNSIEQKLEWLNDVMNFKNKVAQSKVKYSEAQGKKEKVKVSSSYEISIGGDSTPDFTNSFIEEFDTKTKEIITSSFINEVENEVNQRKKLQEELKSFNKTHSPSERASFASPAGAANKNDDDDDNISHDIDFDDSAKGPSFYVIIAAIVIMIAVAGWWVFSAFSDKSEQDAVGSASLDPISVVPDEPVDDSESQLTAEPAE